MTNKEYKEIVLPSIVISFNLKSPVIQTTTSIMTSNSEWCAKQYMDKNNFFGLYRGLFNLN